VVNGFEWGIEKEISRDGKFTPNKVIVTILDHRKTPKNPGQWLTAAESGIIALSAKNC
jgi:hypothetical protein